jgi:hypothetical protein
VPGAYFNDGRFRDRDENSVNGWNPVLLDSPRTGLDGFQFQEGGWNGKQQKVNERIGVEICEAGVEAREYQKGGEPQTRSQIGLSRDASPNPPEDHPSERHTEFDEDKKEKIVDQRGPDKLPVAIAHSYKRVGEKNLPGVGPELGPAGETSAATPVSVVEQKYVVQKIARIYERRADENGNQDKRRHQLILSTEAERIVRVNAHDDQIEAE